MTTTLYVAFFKLIFKFFQLIENDLKLKIVINVHDLLLIITSNLSDTATSVCDWLIDKQ